MTAGKPSAAEAELRLELCEALLAAGALARCRAAAEGAEAHAALRHTPKGEALLARLCRAEGALAHAVAHARAAVEADGCTIAEGVQPTGR